MDRVTYILNTAMIVGHIRRHPHILYSLIPANGELHVLGLSNQVRCKALRGLLKVNTKQHLQLFPETIAPMMDHLSLTADVDRKLSAQLWANMRNQGKQLSEFDYVWLQLLLNAWMAPRIRSNSRRNSIIASQPLGFTHQFAIASH